MDVNHPPAEAGTNDRVSDLINDVADRLTAGESVDLFAYRERAGSDWEEFASVARMLAEIIDLHQTECDPEQTLDIIQVRPASLPVDQMDCSDPVDHFGPISRDTDHATCRLGEFRLLRELGRGGMGVVYEAEQTTLSRRVALKVMHPPTPWTPQQLFRFQQETRAAALLRHPHIITIHSIGHLRGRHYYAMDFINAGSVAEIIEALRTNQTNPRAAQLPWVASYAESRTEYYRTVAENGANLAEALQHAHEQGVIHRDVKPSNILVDRAGHVWLADFGLARIPGASELTRTGDRLGTLRYMSPEQATGQKLLDHRTDLYSLGATLYELATLHPPFEDEDPVVLLRNVADQEPIPPSQIARELPRDLAVVIQKAMSKSPADRYSTAQELANDLRRFRRGEPVQARTISSWARARRWANRHRLTASLVISTLLLTLLMAIAGPLWAWRYAQLAREAESAREASDRHRIELQRLLTDTLITSTERLENTPHVNELHRDLVYKSLQHYAKLLEFAGQNRQVQLDVARGYMTLGRVVALRFSEQQSLPIFEKTIEILRPCLEQKPHDRDALLILQNVYFCLGSQGWNRQAMGESIRILQELLARYPTDRDVRSELGSSEQFFGAICCDEGDLDLALEYGLRSLATFEALMREGEPTPDSRSGLAYGLLTLAETRRKRGDFVGAERELSRAFEVTTPIRSWIHEHLRTRIGFATGNLEYGDLLCRLGRRAEAEGYLQRAVDQLTEIIDGFPESQWARSVLIRSHLASAELYERQGDWAAAEDSCRRAIEAAENALPAALNGDPLARANYRLASIEWHTGRKDDARIRFAATFDRLVASHESHQTLAAWYSLCPDPKLRNADRGLRAAQEIEQSKGTSRELGFCEYRSGNWQAAIAALNLASQSPRNDDALTDFYLAMAHSKLGQQSQAATWLARGIARVDAPSDTDWSWIQDARAEAEDVVGKGTSAEFLTDSR